MAKKKSSGSKSGGSKTRKPPQIDKMLTPAIGIAIAFLGYYFMKGMGAEIPRIDASDELALREVFFGEGPGAKNYAVLCHTPPEEGSTKKALPISSVFSDAAADGNDVNADFVLLDCQQTLPESGKTVAERFGIDLTKRPSVFVSGAKAGPPRQVPLKHLKTGNMLIKLLRSMLEPHAQKIENTRDLKNKCLNKDICGLLLKGGKPETYVKDAISNLLAKHPDVTFASVDSTVLLMNNLEEYLPEFQKGQHRFVLFRKVSGGLDVSSAGKEEKDEDDEEEGEGEEKKKKKKEDDKKKTGRLVTSILPLEDSISFGSINTLINKATTDKMRKIPSLPTVKTRTKKLEEAERKKRQRFLERQRKQSGGGGSPSSAPGGGGSGGGGAFQSTSNDGSKEGRKAERDRRRQEHRKDNDVKPKTPEEIAEIERSRRQRMAEEEAKWNVGAEEDEGGDYPAEDGDGDEYMDIDGEDEGEEDDDDDEVIDLD